ncbi:hypothetical protein Smp_063330 [Schistosoma mansoni]|uniref:Hypotheticial protein n=1 Tax=Schistosoma mansoni TaxID=6183 RepID=G4VF83_SCHMA|nr:hypothetical protein Smp_063330 [Schistosoma mansoni]|eukprot:XP_018651201.1 hypothetical protein Smp_063330 [Schistosoma mansoni]
MNKSIYVLITISIVCVNWITLDAKPVHLKSETSESGDELLDINKDDQYSDYDELKRIFQEGSINDRQPTKTTPSMATTTQRPITESDKEDNEEPIVDDSDDQSPCSYGGTVFTYTIHGDIDGNDHMESNSHDEDDYMPADDYDFHPIYSWLGRDDSFHQRPRKPYHKPTRNTWYSRYDTFPF